MSLRLNFLSASHFPLQSTDGLLLLRQACLVWVRMFRLVVFVFCWLFFVCVLPCLFEDPIALAVI